MKKYIITFSVIIILFNSFLAYKILSNKSLVYVNTVELYNSFNYKKDLEKQFIEVSSKREQILENIKGKLVNISTKKDNITEEDKINYSRLEYEYRTKETQFNEDNNLLRQEYDSKIFERLNKYIEEYGILNNEKIIFGANGSGNIMFAKESIDKTKDVLEFINNKYEGN